MQIPIGASGFPTVSATQLRTYGAGGFRLIVHEEQRGCPRQWKAKYVERRVEAGDRSYALRYGSLVHAVLYVMEEEGLDPEEALDRCFPADAEPEMFAEARKDLQAYMERRAMPRDRFATLGVELDLSAELYVDEVFGPIWYRGIVDWLGLDPEYPDVLHAVDYKTNRTPPHDGDVKGDVQLKGYDWLVRQMMFRYGGRRVVMHLDAVKWREVEVFYSDQEIEEWHAWAVAVVRKILRDEEAKPRLNPGCDWCPVKNDCPAYDTLPEQAQIVLGQAPDTLNDREYALNWRDRANGYRLLLEKAVKTIDASFQQTAREKGVLTVGDWRWTLEPEWGDVIDMRALHAAVGDRFYDMVSVTKKAIEQVSLSLGTDGLAAMNAAISRVPIGTKVAKKKLVVVDE